jgi:hypothetical protein
MATREYSGSAPACAPPTKQEILSSFARTVGAATYRAYEAGDRRLADNIVAWADKFISDGGLAA